MKIAYFAPIYFDDLKQRPQYIAEELSKYHEIYYIEPTISFIRYLLKGGRHCKGISYDINSKLHIIRLDGSMTLHKSITLFDICNLNSISEKWQLRKLIQECDIVWVGYPGWYSVIKSYKNKKIIYDKMDDNAQLAHMKSIRKYIQLVEPKLLEKSDRIIVSSQKFYEELQTKYKNITLMRNAVEKKDFQGVPISFEPFEMKEYYNYAYFGTIGDWFDFNVIKQILIQHKNNKIYLIGNNLVEKYVDERVIYIDSLTKNELFRYVMQFDIFLYPFKQDNFLESINPVKIYEYIALNKPIIAVRSKETEVLKDYCYLYDNKIPKNIYLKRPLINTEELLKFLDKNSWENRIKNLRKISDGEKK